MSEPQHTSRREVLRSGLRYTALGALLAAAVSLWRRDWFGGQADPQGGQDDWRSKNRCNNSFICGNCRLLADCVLPQASSAKAAKGERS